MKNLVVILVTVFGAVACINQDVVNNAQQSARQACLDSSNGIDEVTGCRYGVNQTIAVARTYALENGCHSLLACSSDLQAQYANVTQLCYTMSGQYVDSIRGDHYLNGCLEGIEIALDEISNIADQEAEEVNSEEPVRFNHQTGTYYNSGTHTYYY